eukprot:4190893-Pleurochrysis_carterae.AAC.1
MLGVRATKCKEPVPVTDLACVRSLTEVRDAAEIAADIARKSAIHASLTSLVEHANTFRGP